MYLHNSDDTADAGRGDIKNYAIITQNWFMLAIKKLKHFILLQKPANMINLHVT